ncbi:MAG: MASE1 domain-containing protein [Cyanobacteria bacterium P01_A01_bin.105]
MGNSQQRINLLRIGVLALVYFLVARLSMTALDLATAASPLWPPAGIALAALLRFRPRLWVGVLLGAIATALSVQLSLGTAIVVSLGSPLQAWVGSWLLRDRTLHQRPWQLPDLLSFIGLGVLVTPLVNTLYSTGVGYVTGLIEPGNLLQNAALMWLGDGMGILVLTPILLLTGIKGNDDAPSRRSWPLELCLCMGLVMAMSTVVFGSQPDSTVAQYPLEYLPFPFVVWAALRLGLRGTTLASFLVSVIAVVGAVYRGGPFITKVDGNLNEAILLLQAYIAVVSVTALVLSVVVTERQQSEAQLARSEASLRNAQAIARLGNWDQYGPRLKWSNQLYHLLGYPPNSEPSRSLFLQRVHPLDRDRVAQAWTQQQSYALDYRLQLPDGTERNISEQVQVTPHRITGTVQDMTERQRTEMALRESETLRTTMYRYLSQELAEELLDQGNTTVGGARRYVSILFADIRGYTRLSEQMAPEMVVDLLNAYFEVMVDVIFEQQGTLDKFIGDAIMAIFGSPVAQTDHAPRAVRTALNMQQALTRFNQQLKQQGRPPIDIGMAINSDHVVTGNIGSSKRMEFTAIGDGVNLTARLEGLTKSYGCGILISEHTYQLCKDDVWVRELDYVKVKGKTQPVYIYELLGLRSETPACPNQTLVGLYHQGRQHYQQQDFQAARDLFTKIVQQTPHDVAARLYCDRCQQLMQSPPDATWDGAWQFETK